MGGAIKSVFEGTADLVTLGAFSTLMGSTPEGGDETATPPPTETETDTGNEVAGAGAKTFDETKTLSKTVDKKKLGTRGLQIPLQTPTTVAEGGVQI